MTYTLDVELFICEVRKHPAIWNANDPDYRFLKRKQDAWAKIANVFIPDFQDLTWTEKLEVFRKLQSKWRNIRDSYVRHSKKNNGKGYMYAKQMTFLEDINKTQQTSDTEEQISWSEEDSGSKKARFKIAESWQEDEETSSTIDNLRRKRSLQDVIEYVDTPLLPDATSSSAEDDDRSFFDSLLPAVRKFNLDQKLEFRSEVILLIKNIRNNKRFKEDPDETTFELH